MSGRLAAQIRQTKPFQSIEEEAALNLLRTCAVIEQRASEFFKDFGLSTPQYNILRILRGAGEAGITCSQISERMVSPDPDVTRLLDRLEARSLIRRERSKEDRRVVLSFATKEALQMMSEIDAPLQSLLKEMFSNVSQQETRHLVRLLEDVRQGFE